MISKTCLKCGGISYSASEKGKWICPYCCEDLSEVEVDEPRK